MYLLSLRNDMFFRSSLRRLCVGVALVLVGGSKQQPNQTSACFITAQSYRPPSKHTKAIALSLHGCTQLCLDRSRDKQEEVDQWCRLQRVSTRDCRPTPALTRLVEDRVVVVRW